MSSYLFTTSKTLKRRKTCNSDVNVVFPKCVLTEKPFLGMCCGNAALGATRNRRCNRCQGLRRVDISKFVLLFNYVNGPALRH